MTKISDYNEPQLRQVFEEHLFDGRLSEEVFRPRKVDNGKASLSRAKNYKVVPVEEIAEESLKKFNSNSKRSTNSLGVCSINQIECYSVHSKLDIHESPSSKNPDHSHLDFNNVSDLDDALFELSEISNDNICIKNW